MNVVKDSLRIIPSQCIKAFTVVRSRMSAMYFLKDVLRQGHCLHINKFTLVRGRMSLPLTEKTLLT